MSGGNVRAWRNAVFILFALGGIAVSTWGPRLPAIRADLGVGDAAVGAALAGVTIGSLAGLAGSAAVLAVLGNRRTLIASFGALVIGIAGVGLSAGVLHSFALTAVAFCILGLGLGIVDVMINVEGAGVEAAAGRTLMPLMHGGWSVGAIVGALIGAGSVALDLDFTVQFVVEALAIAIAALVAIGFLPTAVAAVAQTEAPTVGQRVRGWLAGWKHTRLLVIGLVLLGVELGEGTANSWLTLAVQDGHRQPGAVAALFFVAFAVGETLARFTGGPLVDRIGRVATVRITTAIGVVGVVMFIVGDQAWVVLIGTVLWAAGVSMGFPLGMTAAADAGPNPAAQVGVAASIGYLANLGGPPVIGALSDHFGILGALWLVIALLVVGFVAAGSLAAKSRPKASPSLDGKV